MLSVQPQQFELPRDEISMDSAPTLERSEPELTNKQQIKKSMLSPYKILLAVAVFFILVMASYKVYDYMTPKGTESEINSAHGKLIQHSDTSSSKGKTSSTTGSSSSKTSKNNDKPNLSSRPATKTPIGSNFGGTGSDEDDDEDSNDDKKSGQNNRKFLLSNKSTDTKSKSSKDGTSTEEDSVSVESDDEDVFMESGVNWPVNKDDGVAPLIGSTRP